MVQYMVMEEEQKVLARKRGKTQVSGGASSSSAIFESSNLTIISSTDRTLDMSKFGHVQELSLRLSLLQVLLDELLHFRKFDGLSILALVPTND